MGYNMGLYGVAGLVTSADGARLAPGGAVRLDDAIAIPETTLSAGASDGRAPCRRVSVAPQGVVGAQLLTHPPVPKSSPTSRTLSRPIVAVAGPLQRLATIFHNHSTLHFWISLPAIQLTRGAGGHFLPVRLVICLFDLPPIKNVSGHIFSEQGIQVEIIY